MLLIDTSGRVLLLRAGDPRQDSRWFAPGGALDGGETHADAAVREVQEETGLRIPADRLLGPVWTRDVLYEWHGAIERHVEEFFLVRGVDAEGEAAAVENAQPELGHAHRWWRVDEIASSTERFAPARLGEHLAALLAGATPAAPIDVEE